MIVPKEVIQKNLIALLPQARWRSCTVNVAADEKNNVKYDLLHYGGHFNLLANQMPCSHLKIYTIHARRRVLRAIPGGLNVVHNPLILRPSSVYTWRLSPEAVETSSMSPRERLQQMLSPQSSTTAIDLDELRALMFKGISDIAPQRELQKNNASSTEPSDHIRVLAWRVLLGVVKGSPAEWPKQLEYRRSDYERWKRDFVGGSSSRRGGGATRSEAEHHSDILLMKEIEKDVFRTRSELAFFSGGSIAMQQMLYILFVFAKLHPDVGYVQGMNEILAPIIYVCSTDPSATCSWAAEVEADAFHCFASVMSSLKVLYGRSPQDPLSGADLQMTRFAKLLRQHDPTLWQHLNSVELTPDLYSLRWYMALLAREFSMLDTLRIWDALLADPKRFSFLHYVNSALVRSQRNFLLRNGFAAGLKRLQNLQSSDLTLNISDLLSSAEQMRQVDRSLDAEHQAAKPIM